MTFEPLHISSRRLIPDELKLFNVLQYQRYRKPPNSEAVVTLSSIPKDLRADMQVFVHRNEPNRPHISSVYSQCQTTSEHKTPETKPTSHATNLLAQPADTARYFHRASLQVTPAAPSGAPPCASAPPVKGVLSITPNSRKRFFHLSAKNHQLSGKYNNINTLNKQFSAKQRATAETKGNKRRIPPVIHRLKQRLTKELPRNTQLRDKNKRRYHVCIVAVSQRWERRAEKVTFLKA